MKTFLSTILIAGVLFVSGQSGQAEYLEAKRQFNLGNYSTAQQSFAGLTDDKVFGAYASFFYALSALKQGQSKEAYDMWRQIQLNFPEWDQQTEVRYWLGYTAFSQRKYWEGFKHIETIPTELKESLIRNEFLEMPLEELQKAYALNQDNVYIGSYLAKAIMQQPYDQRDKVLLDELSSKFGIEVAIEELKLPTVKKNKYAVAAVLPFMFDSLENPQPVLRNTIIMDLYLGMVEAKRDLQNEGIFLELYPFDTQKKAENAEQLVANGYLDNADVIVGPLYGGPNKVISSFSAKNKITMINPLSSNEEIIGGNPFSYLYKPSYATQGRVAAAYARKYFNENKLACVFFETDRDSLVANAYKDAIEADSFLVLRFERLTQESARQLQDEFVEQYEVRLDTLYSQEEIDSIGLISGRYVKTRPLRDEDDGSIIKDRKGEDVLEYYENRFVIQDDTIGHFFVASASNLLANNFIGLREVRSDTIGLIGYDNWLNFTLTSYEQLERLEVAFLSPGYIDKNGSTYEELKKDFILSIGREPGEYHIIGYEMLMHIGRLMKEHGTYFQKGLIGGEHIPGIIMGGMEYGTYNDNQVVPVIKLEDFRLIRQNLALDQEENED